MGIDVMIEGRGGSVCEFLYRPVLKSGLLVVQDWRITIAVSKRVEVNQVGLATSTYRFPYTSQLASQLCKKIDRGWNES